MKLRSVFSTAPGVYALLSALALISPTHANPVGESVAAGNATFDRLLPGVLSIQQGSARAIINWADFSIGAGELTRFIQPGANSAVLNRVLGGNPSEIYGTLRANGQLILLNPAGVLVGPGGRVDTKGFLATTLNLSDEDFLTQTVGTDSTPSLTFPGTRWNASLPGKGVLRLSGDSKASVKNAGVVKGGNVYLVARQVENSGVIRASHAGLVGGTEVVMGGGSGQWSVISRQGSVVRRIRNRKK